MDARWNADRRSHFYRVSAWGALVVALAGFFLTYTLPLARGEFAGPGWSHAHGALLLAWLLLTIAQANLAASRLRLHRKLGWAALALAPAIAASTMAIGVEATRRDLAAGVMTGMAGNVTAPIVFVALVAAALTLRRDPQWHKRLILIATVVLLWPAWFRWRHFLPGLPRPDITLGVVATNAIIAAAMVRDRLRCGAVHPAYLWVGLPVIAWQLAEALAFGTPTWTRFGLWLYHALS